MGFEEFSWQDGIDRLLTEFARGELMDELFPGNETEGVDNEGAENFGKLAEFVSLLRQWKHKLPQPRRAGEWKEFLCSWADIFFDPSDRDLLPELLELRRAVRAVAAGAEKAGVVEEKIPPGIFIRRFGAEVSVPGGRQHFLRDKITFCSLVPLRTIPAKVIAVLSLNEEDFPLSDRRQNFDLLSEALRGDPNRAEESKYQLLEALMAAKEHLILSYVGKEDTKAIEPSVPLNVCITALKEGFGIEPEPIRLPPVESEELLRRREDPQVFRPPAAPGANSPGPQAGVLEPPRSMDLPELCRHLIDSCGAFFELHSGFPFSPWQDKTPKVDDPAAPDPLDSSVIGQSLWRMRLDGAIPPEERRRRFENTRLLPVCCGQEALDELCGKIDAIGDEELRIARESEPHPFELSFDWGFTLCGRVPVCRDGDKVWHQEFLFSKDSLEKKLRFCVARLLVAACTGKEVAGSQHFIFDEKHLLFAPPAPADARANLADLLKIVLGNYTRPAPVPLFLNASFAYAGKKSPFSVRQEFRQDCAPRSRPPSAIGCFYTEDVLEGKEFKELADRVFGKLIVLEKHRS